MFVLNKAFYKENRNRGLPYLGVNTWTFVYEWLLCRDDAARPIDNLFSMLDPAVKHWVKMFLNTGTRNVQFATLFNLIEGGDKLQVLEAWLEYHTAEDIYDLCIDIYLSLLRHPPHRITVKPKQYAFLLSRLFIYRLSHKIRDWYLRETKSYKLNITDTSNQIPEDMIIDLIDVSKLSPLHHYLIYLLYSGFTRDEIVAMSKSVLSHSNIRSIANEWKEQERINQR